MASKLSIAISYPPIVNDKGQKAMVSQNRNVQYFQKPTYLLPVVHAQAATWLKEMGHDVIWDDGNAQLKTYDQWFDDLVQKKPDMVVFESTTPVMKFYWKTVNQLKSKLPKTTIVMTGYHSMRMPIETMENSQTDVVLKSNHVDFALRRLVEFIAANDNWKAEIDIEGLTVRNGNDIRDTGAFKQVETLETSPIINRDLTEWKNYAFENGNFLQTPGTYATSVIRDCMFGKCTFCRYNGPELTFSMMDIERSLDEYENLINNYGVREIFDDSGVWYRAARRECSRKALLIVVCTKKGVISGSIQGSNILMKKPSS